MAKNNEQASKKPDITWQLTLANWFLIYVLGAALAPGPALVSGDTFGYALGYASMPLFFGGVITAAIYVLNPKRASMRVRLTLTVCGWILALSYLSSML